MVIGIIFISLLNLFSHQQIIYSKKPFCNPIKAKCETLVSVPLRGKYFETFWHKCAM